MRPDAIILVGAGGHASVVLEAMLAAGMRDPCVLDDAPGDRELLGRPVGFPAVPTACVSEFCAFHVAIGCNAARSAKFTHFLRAGMKPVTVVHPHASVSPSATLAPGVFIAARAVVGPLARVGAGAVVNHGAVVDHGCDIGEFVHVAPNATLGGGSVVGPSTLVGSGAILFPGIVLGTGATVGAGAVVRRNVPSGTLVVGVPARLVVRHGT
jgi:sugar O-acyltransferase (sialic acid O-acetyltransferase NeuD family)